jgi:Ca2+-binding EF-hand superfamily protein
MNLLVKHMHPKEIRELTKEFQNLDEDKSGFLTHREMTEVIKKHQFG